MTALLYLPVTTLAMDCVPVNEVDVGEIESDEPHATCTKASASQDARETHVAKRRCWLKVDVDTRRWVWVQTAYAFDSGRRRGGCRRRRLSSQFAIKRPTHL